MSKFGDLLKGQVSTPVPDPVVEEAPPRPEEEVAAVIERSEVNFSKMTKKQLEAYGRTVGIELDRRHSKSRLIKELKQVL